MCRVVGVLRQGVWQGPGAPLGVGRLRVGAARKEDAQGPPTRIHISPSILVYEDESLGFMSQGV